MSGGCRAPLCGTPPAHTPSRHPPVACERRCRETCDRTFSTLSGREEKGVGSDPTACARTAQARSCWNLGEDHGASSRRAGKQVRADRRPDPRSPLQSLQPPRCNGTVRPRRGQIAFADPPVECDGLARDRPSVSFRPSSSLRRRGQASSGSGQAGSCNGVAGRGGFWWAAGCNRGQSRGRSLVGRGRVEWRSWWTWVPEGVSSTGSLKCDQRGEELSHRLMGSPAGGTARNATPGDRQAPRDDGGLASPSSRPASRAICVVFPDPSIPSKVTKQP